MNPPLEGDSVSANVPGVTGTNTTDGPGVFGKSQGGEGVHGESNNPNTAAVAGFQLNANNPIGGVYGEHKGNGPGLFGRSKGNGPGVFGTSQGGEGVHGDSNNPNTAAVAGFQLNANNTIGAVYGEHAGNGPGLFGRSKGNGPGVFGTSQGGEGVHGESNNPNTAAVAGFQLNASNPIGGVYGEHEGNGPGCLGFAKGNGWGVYGHSPATGVAGDGTGPSSGNSVAIGVTGTSGSGSGISATNSNASYPVILGRTDSPNGTGVVGYARASTGKGIGVIGITKSGLFDNSDPPIGVWGISAGLAGAFSGDVLASHDMTVVGTFTAANKHFRIDHPLDPANKYLVHASIESSEMIDVYSGNITTDGVGDATVSLPDYFQAIHDDFRYQLTVVGQFAQVVVSAEIENNRFKVKTDKPNVKVSWQVAGVRRDNYAKAHPLVVEQEKLPAERGLFLHPELFNQPKEKGLGIPVSRSASLLLDYDIRFREQSDGRT
jgi:hypothetical protein